MKCTTFERHIPNAMRTLCRPAAVLPCKISYCIVHNTRQDS